MIDDGNQPAGAARARLLVVEDESSHQQLAALTVGRRFDMDLAATASQALALLEANRYAAVLTDNMLGGGMTGTELMREFRRRHPDDRTPFIALTAYGGPDARREMLGEGFDEYCAKPPVYAELIRLLERLIARRGVNEPPGR